MAFDLDATVQEEGRLNLVGLPFESGQEVHVHVDPVSPISSAQELSPEEWIRAFHETLDQIHARHPNTPVLTEEAMSRESIYEDRV